MKALATKRARIGGVDGHDLERHASRLASDHAVGARHPKHKLTTLRLDQVPGYLSKLRPYFSSIENASPIAPWFLDNDYKFFSYIQNAKEEKRQSKRLLEKYKEVGMCGFRYPRGNGFSNHPKRKRFGFAYLSSETPAAIRETIEPFLNC